MRHRRRIRKLGRKTAHREAMLRNMVTSLLEHGRIVTTVTRAKELRRLADKMVTLAKDGGLHARRQAMSVIMDKMVVAKLFNHWADEMSEKNGGYTRIVRIGPRHGDAAMMCYIEMATDALEKTKGKKAVYKSEKVAEPVIPQAAPPAEASGSVDESMDQAMAEEDESSEESQTREQTSAETSDETGDKNVSENERN